MRQSVHKYLIAIFSDLTTTNYQRWVNNAVTFIITFYNNDVIMTLQFFCDGNNN